MHTNEAASPGVPRRIAWLVLGAAVIAHPAILYLRALITGFSDSGLLGGTFSFTVFTIMFMTVVGGLFAIPVLLSTNEAVVNRLPLAAIVLLVGAAHVVVAVGISTSGSNSYALAYPAFAVLAVATVLTARQHRPRTRRRSPKTRTARKQN